MTAVAGAGEWPHFAHGADIGVRGEPVDVARHAPAVEVKGATFTELAVRREPDGRWCVQCVLDV